MMLLETEGKFWLMPNFAHDMHSETIEADSRFANARARHMAQMTFVLLPRASQRDFYPTAEFGRTRLPK